MSFHRTQPFTDAEYDNICVSFEASRILKQQSPKISQKKYAITVKEYENFLAKLKRLQQWGDPIECGRTGEKNTDNVFGWALDQLTWTQQELKPDLELSEDYQMARTALRDAALNRRPGPGPVFKQLFGDDNDHDQE